MMNFASVSKTVATIYMVDDVIVNLCVLLFLISFVLMNFFTVKALEYSISKTFKICSIFIIAGAWTRYAMLE
jgi:hypothetical protein